MTATPAASKPAPPPPAGGRALVAAAAASTAVLVLRLAPAVGRQFADSEELHALLCARLLLAGDVLHPALGSLTSYEGGSWLLPFPVAVALAAGLDGTVATGVVAAAGAALGAFFASLWAGRLAGWPAAAAVGPLLALTSPQFTAYGVLATGGTPDSLFALPLLGLLGATWVTRGRPRRWLPVLGLALGAAAVLSYLHLVTCLVFALVQATEGRLQGNSRERAKETLLVGAAVLVMLVAWHYLVSGGTVGVPSVRGGVRISSIAGLALIPRLDLVAVDVPRAWAGPSGDVLGVRVAAGGVLSVLGLAAAVVAWRRGGPNRWPVLLLATCALAGAASRTLAEEQADLARYYLPVLATSVVLIASWRPAAAAVGLACGLVISIPGPAEPVPIWPDRAHSRLAVDYIGPRGPDAGLHEKYARFAQVTEPQYASALALGHGAGVGLQLGERGTIFGRAEEEVLGRTPGAPRAELRPDYLFGLGVGIAADRILEEEELQLLVWASPRERSTLLAGLGAGLLVMEGTVSSCETSAAVHERFGKVGLADLRQGWVQIHDAGETAPPDCAGVPAAPPAGLPAPRDPVRADRARFLQTVLQGAR